jgi:hypothetical protein
MPLQFVDILSQHYKPLQYLLLFPHGTSGWGRLEPLHEDNDRSNIHCEHFSPYSQIQWYCHLLLTEPRFLSLGRLTCEYVVDMFSRTEDEQLCFLQFRHRRHGSIIEQTNHQTSADIIQNTIPASFMGSRAWVSDKVADALAMACELGNPDIFTTATCNPH